MEKQPDLTISTKTVDLAYKRLSALLYRRHPKLSQSTTAERRAAAVMQRMSIRHFPQYWIGYACVDFFLPDYGIVLEVNGHVHNRPWKMRKDGSLLSEAAKADTYVATFTNRDVWQQTFTKFLSSLKLSPTNVDKKTIARIKLLTLIRHLEIIRDFKEINQKDFSLILRFKRSFGI